jgi:dGTPase
MNRQGAEEIYVQQRDILASLVSALVLRGGQDIEPWLAPQYDRAATDGVRLRVVIDQVASLTDASALEWHQRLCS